jgi:midasin (ATPase involved in ribosome maturation)
MSLITVRDMIKWANRKNNMLTKEDVAHQGFSLLGEKI